MAALSMSSPALSSSASLASGLAAKKQAKSSRRSITSGSVPSKVVNQAQRPEDVAQGTVVGRREAFLQLAALSTAAVAVPSLSLPEPALAADIIQRQQRTAFLDKLKIALAGAVDANQDLIPALLRLAINDAVSYDKESKSGGANGSIRFAEELSRPENAGLKGAMDLLEGVKAQVEEGDKSGPLGYADLIQFGGAAGCKRTFINACITKAGGDKEKGINLYRAIGSNGQWGFFDKQLGRADTSEADPAGRVFVWDALTPAELKAKFEPFRLKPRQITVLSIFLSDKPAELEARLAEDPEFLPWVAKYRKSRNTVSQTDYEVDLIDAFTKFSLLGTKINTEAYSYALPPVRLRL